LADLRDLDRELALSGLQPPRPIPVAQPRRRLRAALIARAAQPRLELLLDRALDDQPRPQLGQLSQRLTRILTHADREQLVDLSFDLRRRRYGTSHGVGLLHCLGGREGTYAVALTAPRLFTAVLRRDPSIELAIAMREQEQWSARLLQGATSTRPDW
jgi:hypothetical protein